ncbi:MAG TPA: hypothetical protein VFR88_06280, partial [Microlunatus sp.]|nr:hypothetical protein [Microlunatus sp.]
LDPRLVGDDVAGALRVALDDPVPGYAARAAELGTELAAAGGVARAADLVEVLAATRRPVTRA